MKLVNLGKLNILNEHNKVIPIFFACDDGYVKYLMVALRSLIDNSDPKKRYMIHVLSTYISEDNLKKLKSMERVNVWIEYFNVSAELEKIKKMLSVRDYYSLATYYRIFIPELFPEYDKVLYLDSDIIINRDIAELYNFNLGDNYVGAIQDYLIANVETFGDYAENVLGISRSAYFNAGILLINSREFRRKHLKKKFVELLNTYTFVVAQDQDYLNILCQNKVLWLRSRWNVQMAEENIRPLEQIGIIHYNFAEKPWHKKDMKYGDVFWNYAENTPDYGVLKYLLSQYSEKDQKRDREAGEHLIDLAKSEIASDDNYFRLFLANQHRSITRQEIKERIAQYEREGRFDEDVEDDPPSRMLMPDEIDYLDRSIRKRISTRYAFQMARWFVRYLIRNKQLVIKEYKGLENYRSLKSGAVITCNHFNAYDSFAMQMTYEKSRQFHRKFYRIIREGNYTNFPGFFGFLMRNCNTLPLSSNSDTMKKLLKAVDKILQRGDFILIYPEQSMWWNYRKPKPLKRGGYIFAARNNVPVLPCFITMEDTNIPGDGGFPVQAYTVHIAPPIYPDPNKSKNENVKEMMQKNFKIWKEIYESTYGIPLTYTTEKKDNR